MIGHVTKLTGSATAIRNGVSIILNNGDNVEKGDVVQSGSDSTLGITFIDGTVFGLSSNARMVLNEMVYDPNGSNNSSLLSLVAGTISFVAGETAKHGDMKIDTPVATMGIRGTAVLVEIDFRFRSPALPAPVARRRSDDPDNRSDGHVPGSGRAGRHHGLVHPVRQADADAAATVNKAGQYRRSANGISRTGNAPLSPDAQKLITDVFALKFTDNTNTKTFDQHTDSLTPQTEQVVLTANGATATATVIVANNIGGTTPEKQTGTSNNNFHIHGQLHGVVLNSGGNADTAFAVTELAGVTHDTTNSDHIGGVINFTDINAGDAPIVTVSATLDAATPPSIPIATPRAPTSPAT